MRHRQLIQRGELLLFTPKCIWGLFKCVHCSHSNLLTKYLNLTFFSIFIVSITLVKIVCVICCIKKYFCFKRERKKQQFFAPLYTVSLLSAMYLICLFMQPVTI